MNKVDETATARLFLQRTASKEYLIGLLNELARAEGMDLNRGDTAMIHPDNVPDYIQFWPSDPVQVTDRCAKTTVLFIPTGSRS